VLLFVRDDIGASAAANQYQARMQADAGVRWHQARAVDAGG
jgi:hypothetical protein